ncbi:hypothetical protein [Sutcliffiella rhizosphaerae]|uniref:Uncharacterized protein n=1 Tax=Sutcliffiella rhizosphaerae TaxID=2880967 RepID=A0ABN8AFD2_9BACI|nr:hypothetical protein [Sutcliffiella rhizosphaerae]CAG9622817.1 hypothetical protein BACCIP111883_03608 [Sutcliffiella rhizosphaerae]
MGIVYVEGCYDDCCREPYSRNKRKYRDEYDRGSCFPQYPPCPPYPPFPSDLAARLAAAEATIASNTARIAALEAQVGAPIDTIRAQFQANLNNTVTVNTSFDVVSGTVTTVGIDAAELTTPTGDIFIIPYTSVISIV